MNSGWNNETSDQRCWEAWLSQHVPALLLFARQQSGSEADAQDLVQEAVVESWQRQDQGQPPPLPLVFATIRRRAIDRARAESRRANREAVVVAEAPGNWFDSTVEARERARLLQVAMKALPEIYRAVITLKIWGELTFAEIGEALEIPANTAASRYRYGLEELRKATREILT